MAKLQPDYINFVLSLNADQAQEEIHKLEKASKELKEENKELKKSMTELTATGKRDTEEFRRLEAQLKKNNKAISENSDKTQELLSRIDKQNKSYSQLAKEARNLQRQLENTVKSLNPEEYDRLQKELDETRAAMKRLRDESGDKGLLRGLDVVKTTIAGIFGQIGYNITNAIGNAIGAIKQFASEAIDLATKADGVTHAFEQLNRPDILANLRAATKGTVSDLQLMTATVKARDFRIPIDDLGKYLAFAQLKAQQTGQSVEFMTDSIVTGLGRKSLLILDNLGLSAAEINEEVARTGDFMQGVANIVDRQLQQAGQYVSAADEVAQVDIKMENAKLKLGQRLSWLGDMWTRLRGLMADNVNSVLTTANERFQEQKEEVIGLCTEYLPLLDRYDRLKAKSELTATEQAELNSIIAQITGTIPGVISQFDQYGNALDINTDKARQFIEQQKVLLQYNNRAAIEEEEKNLAAYRSRYEAALSVNQHGGRYTTVQTGSGMGWGGSAMVWDDSTETLKRAEEDVAKYGALVQGAELNLKKLRGESLDDALKAHTERTRMRDTFIKMNKAQLQQWLADEKNANSQYRELANSILTGKGSPTDEDAKEKEKADKAAAKAREKAEKEAAKAAAEQQKREAEAAKQREEEEKAMRDFLTRYGTFQQKKEAIAKEYAARIAKATAEGEKLSLQKQLEEALQDLDFSEFKKSMNWEQIFGNLSLYSSKKLKELRKELQEFIKNDKTLNESDKTELIEQYHKLGEAIAKDEMALSDLFGFKSEQQQQIRLLEEEYELRKGIYETMKKEQGLAAGQYESDKSALSSFLSGKGISFDISNIDFESISKQFSEKGDIIGKGIFEGLFKNFQKSGTELTNLTSKVGEASGAMEGAGKALQGAGSSAASTVGMIDTIIHGINDNIQSMTELMEILELDDTKFGEGWESFARSSQYATQAWESLKSGNIMGVAAGVAGSIKELGHAVGSWFGWSADYSQYNKMVEEYNALEEVWDRLISKKQEYIDISYGDEARKAAQEAEEIIRTRMGSLYALGVELLNSGASWGSSSIGVRQRDNMSDKAWAELRTASQNIGFNYNSVAGSRMEGLFDLSAKQLADLQEQAPTFWAKLDDGVRNYLQKIIDCGDELEQMKQQVQETMTGVSFDSFYDNFVSTLSDMEKDSQDFADDFGEYLKNAILSNLLANKYRQRIEALYEAWAGKSDSNGDGVFDLTAEESETLKGQMKQLAEELTAERDAMAEAFGWGAASAAQQEASSKGFATLSQDTGEELSGRFTAMHVVLTEMARGMSAQLECTTEMRDILYECNDHLSRIARYAGTLTEMNETLNEIEKNTKEL